MCAVFIIHPHPVTATNNTGASSDIRAMSLESHEQPSVTGHGQNSVSGTELASERTEIMEITADQWPQPSARLCSLLDSVIDLFNLRTLMPVRGHYWSGLRDAGWEQKLQDCEEKRVNNRWEEIGEMRVSGGREMYWQELIFLILRPWDWDTGQVQWGQPASREQAAINNVQPEMRNRPWGLVLAQICSEGFKNQQINSRGLDGWLDLNTRKRPRLSNVPGSINS